jgi:hypothetical protein
LKKYSMRSSVETGLAPSPQHAAGDAASCVSTDDRTPLPQKTTGTRTTSVHMPAKGQILRQLYRYSFSPVLGFKNSVPLLLILLKLNIWVMELASASNEPWPMRCPLSQLSSTNRMIEV